MKNTPFLFGILMLMALQPAAQDTLSLNIPERTAGILLKFKNTILREEGSSINTVPKAEWTFKISSKKNGYKTTIINTEGNDSIRLTNLNQAFAVTGNELKTSVGNFGLKSNLAIKIYNESDQLIKTYSLKYVSGQTGVAVDNSASDSANRKTVSAYSPGSAVNDALFLADPTSASAVKYQILTYYANNETDPVKLKNIYTTNKFLDSVVSDVAAINRGQGGGIFSTAFSAVGGLDVTNITDALAKLLVKRTKQELSAAFFDRFNAVIHSVPDLETLFPATSNLLLSIGDEAYNYERYLQNIREAFIQDISALEDNFPGIVDNHPAYFLRHQEMKAALLSACYVANELENQAHPGDVLANYPLEYLSEGVDGSGASLQPYKAAIQTVQMISESFRDTNNGEGGHYWVSIRKVRELVNNRRALKYYLGLLFQDARYKFDSIRFERTASFIEQLNKVADVYDKGTAVYNAYRTYVLKFGEKVEALNHMIDAYKQPAADSSAMEKYQKYFRAAVDMIQYCTAISQLPLLKDIPSVRSLPQKLKPYFAIAYGAADLVIDINKRNYAAAINHAVFIYNEVKTKPAKADLVPGVESLTVIHFSSDSATASHSRQFQRTMNLLVRYGSFMSAVASAKTSDEAEQAIEVFALPPGSSRIKRETIFNVSLNAYAGLYTGYERIKGVDKLFRLNSYGVTAPIGVAISKGHSMFFLPSTWGSSSSLFMSFIDIGAVTAFRFTDDAAEKIPTIQLKQIISPGIFYSFGFGKTPLSANIGYQAGPLLRKVRLNENQYEKKYSRFSISLCVDIPVINFYTKSE